MPKPLSSLRLEPEARIFFPAGAEEKVTRTLKITNISEDSMAWKVRAAVVDAERDAVERADWAEFGESQQEVALLRALRTSSGAPAAPWVNGREGGQGRSEYTRDRSERLGRDHRASDESYDLAEGEGTEEWDGSQVPRRRCQAPGYSGYGGSNGSPYGGGSAGWEGRRGGERPPWLYEGRAGMSSESTTRRRSSRHDEPDLVQVTDDDPQEASNVHGVVDVDKPPPMGPITKTVLGLLIAVLVFNLYLRPLLDSIAAW